MHQERPVKISTVRISQETKNKLARFGSKGDSFEDIIKKVMDSNSSASREESHPTSQPPSETIEEHKPALEDEELDPLAEPEEVDEDG